MAKIVFIFRPTFKTYLIRHETISSYIPTSYEGTKQNGIYNIYVFRPASNTDRRFMFSSNS